MKEEIKNMELEEFKERFGGLSRVNDTSDSSIHHNNNKIIKTSTHSKFYQS